MQFISTRNKNIKLSFSEAITKGISAEGGLFVPESFPMITKKEMNDMLEMPYDQRANLVLSKYMTDFSLDEISQCTSKAYSRFEEDPAPLVKMDEGLYLLELFHGPTLAFKDIALTLFPQVLSIARKKLGIKEEILILVATSGDTGKAALEGFRDVDGIKIIVFYPSEGVAYMQKLQMSTQKGNNLYVAAVKGNFDNCQTGVKEIFGNIEIEKEFKDLGYSFSSANSINLGRLLPQVVYYFSAYLDLVSSNEIKMGDKINFTIPTGNFGNILAGYYAKQMGLPINKLICASNSNNVLTDFFKNGKYDANRKFYKTMSPSMDILISSNLERLLFELFNRDDNKVASLMSSLKSTGVFEIGEDEIRKLNEVFYADMADEDNTKETINVFYDDYGYPLDTHTAVGVYAADNYIVDNEDYLPMVILSTASPYKFTESVLSAIGEKVNKDPFINANTLMSVSAMDIPEAISELRDAKVRFNDVFEIKDMIEAIRKFIEIKE